LSGAEVIKLTDGRSMIRSIYFLFLMFNLID
jgi:hypothetical protein